MHLFNETRIMPYDSELIYNIVSDIEKYPEFLPWCKSVTIISTNEKYLTAQVEISFKGFKESYVCKVFKKKIDSGYKIEVDSISGAFRHLNNVWKIKSIKNTSEVTFSIDFKMKSTILNIVIGKVFSIVVEKIIAAFEFRIKKMSIDAFESRIQKLSTH